MAINQTVKIAESPINGAVLEPRLSGLPPLVKPLTQKQSTVIGAAEWLAANKESVETQLQRFGALVFRGFGLNNASDFNTFIGCYPVPSSGYAGGVSPRNRVTGNVMEATNAPSDRVIKLHQEMAYARDYPAKLAFFCERSPSSGGETTIGDMREVTRRLNPSFLSRLRDKGVRYQRFFRSPDWVPGHAKLDVVHRTWCETFGTENKEEAEAVCLQTGSTFEWVKNGLIASYNAEAVKTHSGTGEEVLFNGFTGFHLNRLNLGDTLFELYENYYGSDNRRPYAVFYGDGQEISKDDVFSVYPLLEAVTVAPRWQNGDVMLVDNILTAHGRASFTGERMVRVALLN